ncbi:hypothetical protein [Mycolicibacterium brisbanense]|uniref:Uncharacterized protein n=1 Tax=Mycolicibacterium brisbanense TaxID=146020 RepID=A0A117I4A6_9MYCO|nr:hypothetical protein [Mycolicibacterium brisbanense]MCV7156744.1 hypothetical protein [Mycolicibacterium brisbanense]GAS86642.1 uncharacterized protein RMCB_0738 [Mycolicibacterium brisbanense]
MHVRYASALVLATVVGSVALAACDTVTAGAPQPEPDAGTSTSQPAAAPTPTPLPTRASQAPVSVPALAWISADRIPQNADQPWPDLAGRAEPLGRNTFLLYALCGATPSPLAGGDHARAVVDNGDGYWSAQQVIVHYPGDPWTMGQTAGADFSNLQDILTHCTDTPPEITLQSTTPAGSPCPSTPRGGCHQVAAEIRSPKGSLGHIYLANVGSTVTELTVWATGTPVKPWAGTPDEDVFAAMNPQLCTVWEC